ncbi:MAG: acetolactate synthase small subunit, partial [Campylobacter jejuni]|nr:acetolactate synthase small subunit [Campylobacter jejuni]
IIANSNENFLFLMVADDANRIDNFLKTIKKYNPSDIVRSGSVLMEIK